MNPDIYICGTGNVGTALLEAFVLNGLPVKGIYSSSKANFYLGIPVKDYKEVPPPDSMVILAVPDDVIRLVEKFFHHPDLHLIHCSGSVGLDALTHRSRGVFYPLQTWTRNIASNWAHVPVLVESEDESLQAYLMQMAQSIHANPTAANSEQRKALHIAAVFANNFGNAMFTIAFELAQKAGFDPEILKPLIAKTADKLHTLSPAEAQTGPAKRGDEKVMQQHLEALQNDPVLQKMYQDISDWIGRKHRG